MQQRFLIILGFGLLLGVLYLLCMRATPGRGLCRMVEKLCIGIVLCYLCQVVLRPFGVRIAQSPLAALSAGYLGLPGVALCSILASMP